MRVENILTYKLIELKVMNKLNIIKLHTNNQIIKKVEKALNANQLITNLNT